MPRRSSKGLLKDKSSTSVNAGSANTANLQTALLYEIEEAKLCLLNPRLRKDYDEKLAEGKPKPREQDAVVPPPFTNQSAKGTKSSARTSVS